MKMYLTVLCLVILGVSWSQAAPAAAPEKVLSPESALSPGKALPGKLPAQTSTQAHLVVRAPFTIPLGDTVTLRGTVSIQRQGDSVSVALNTAGGPVGVVMDQQARQLLGLEGQTVEVQGVMEGGRIRVQQIRVG